MQDKKEKKKNKKDHIAGQKKANKEKNNMVYCPECGAGPVVFQEGCFLCYACGYSKCS